jgi:DNA replication protein DnaC
LKNSEIYSKADNALEKIRRRNARISEQRKTEIYDKIPAVKDIHSQMLANDIDCFRMKVKSGGSAALIRSRKEELSQKIAALLTEYGYPADYLDPIYDCGSCKDTGYSGHDHIKNRCGCFFVHLANTVYSIPEFALPENISFSAFDISLFDGLDASSRQQKSDYILSVKDLLESFCATGKNKNYYLFGKTGTGKTFFLISMAKLLLKNRIPSLYLTSGNLFRITQEYKASVFSDDRPDPFLYNYIYSTQVLLIDDLGSESITPSKYSELLEIINQRLQREKPTVIAGNLSPLDLKKMYDERVYSRIIGSYEPIRLPGDDLRLIIKRRSYKI